MRLRRVNPLTLSLLTLASIIPLLAILQERDPEDVTTIVALLGILYAIVPAATLLEGRREVEFTISPRRALLLILVAWALSPGWRLSMDAELLLHIPSALATAATLSALALPMTGGGVGDLESLLRAFMAGAGISSLIAYILFILNLQALFPYAIMLILLIGSLRNRSLRVRVELTPGFAVVLAILSLFSALSALMILNPENDQFAFISRAVWKDREPWINEHTLAAPLGAYIPEYLGSRLLGVHPWPLDLFLFPLMNLLFQAALASRLGREGPLGYLCVLAGDLTLLHLLSSPWDSGRYVSVSWSLAAGLYQPRTVLLKDVIVAIGIAALSGARPVVIALALPYLLFTQTVLTMALLPVLLLLRRDAWRHIVAGSTVATLLIAIAPGIMLENLWFHMLRGGVPPWIIPLSPVAVLLLTLLLTRVRIPRVGALYDAVLRLLSRPEIFALLAVILPLLSLAIPDRYSPVLMEAHTWSLVERSASVIRAMMGLLLPWSIAIAILRPRPGKLAATMLMVLLLWTLLPLVFYEPCRISSILPYPFILGLAAWRGRRTGGAILLLTLSLSYPLGHAAFLITDNRGYISRFNDLTSVPEGATIAERELIQYASLTGVDYVRVNLPGDLENAVLMSPDPVLVQALLSGERVHSPWRIRYERYSFISNSGGVMRRGEPIPLPRRLDWDSLRLIWQSAPRSYEAPWGSSNISGYPEMFAQILVLRNATLRFAGHEFRVSEGAIYPSMGYAFAVVRGDGEWPDFDLDPASVSRFLPTGYVPLEARRKGVIAYASILRPDSVEVPPGVSASIQLVRDGESRWFDPGPLGFWGEGLYEVHVHFGDVDLYTYAYHLEGGRVLILPPNTEVSSALALPFCPASNDYKCFTERELGAVKLEYSSGNVLLLSKVRG